MQNKAAKFAYHTNETKWETLTQRRKIARLCAPHKAYCGEQAWKAVGDRLKRPYFLSRADHDWKIRNRRQRTDIGKYSFVNRTIRHWNRLPAEILGALPCKPNTFRKRVRNMISEVNWRKWKCVEVLSERVVKWSEVKWSVVKWRGIICAKFLGV